MIKTKKQMFTMIGAFLLVIMLGTITYAFFNYTRTGTANTIRTGRIAFNSAQGQAINLTNMFPIDVTGGIPNDATKVGTVTIDVTGDTTYTEGLEYLVSAVNVQNIVGSKSLPISIDVAVASNTSNDPATTLGTANDDYFSDRGGDTSYYKVLAKETINTDDELLVGYIAPGATGVDGIIVIRAYLDTSKIAITDTYDGNETDNMGTTTDWVDDRTVFTTTEWNALQTNGVSFKVKVESNEGIWVEGPPTGTQLVQRAIHAKQNAATNSCNPVFIDDNGTANDESDDITYFSGTNDCVDMNYVWYSGKLWRITAIYPDGTMKLVTANNITTLKWGETVEYNGSWIYQWLNEDFYDTLVNSNNIIDLTSWNYTIVNSSIPSRPELLENQQVTSSKVGLLNLYEYYNSYRKLGNYGYSNGYLRNTYRWWLLNPSSTKDANYVKGSGYPDFAQAKNNTYGVRPSIIIKSNLMFTGDGTSTSPYKIVGDKVSPINNVTLLNTRTSGEYVLFDNELYRIVEIENGITKLTKNDYLKESGEVLTKYNSSSMYFGKSSNTQSDDYWDYYLNNTWYNNISYNYKNMLIDGTYYLGNEGYDDTNYKITTCKDTSLDNVTTLNCTKYTSDDANKTFTGKIGLPRYSEMFSSQISINYSSSSPMWLLTPRFSSNVEYLLQEGDLYSASPSTNYAVRPSLTLKSTIKITGGNGMQNSPFEISE